MLIRFIVNNFLSFRDEVSFSPTPSREKQHAERIFQHAERDLRVLPAAAIYGANGSGKSNFYKAILFVREMVVRPAQSPDDQIAVLPFRLDGGSEKMPSRFSIEVLAPDDRVYRLAFSVTPQRVVEERLDLVGEAGDRLIYLRNEEHLFQPGPWFEESLPQEEKDFLLFKARDTLPNQLLLAQLRGRNIHHVDGIINWFKNSLQLMTPSTVLKQLEVSLPSIAGLRQYCIDALISADTGISGLAPKEVTLNSLPWPDSEKMFRKMIPVGKGMLIAGPTGERYTIRHDEDGQVRATRLTTVHRTHDGRDVEFFMSEESDGTQRFVDLLPAFYELGQVGVNKVLVIDEIDRSLHTELTRSLLTAFLKALVKGSRSQLIFTSHDVMLIDQDLFRRDELWFVQKDKDGGSTIIPLGEKKGVRADRVLLRSYLAGDFGGIPSLKELPSPLGTQPATQPRSSAL
jgi:uncharacterized protein